MRVASDADGCEARREANSEPIRELATKRDAASGATRKHVAPTEGDVPRDGRFRAASSLLVLARFSTLPRTRRLESTSKSTRRAPRGIVQRLPRAVNENLYSLFESRFPKDRASPLLLDSGDVVTYAEADATSAR